VILEKYIADVFDVRAEARGHLLKALDSERYALLTQEFRQWLTQEKCFFIHKPIAYYTINSLAKKLLSRAKLRMHKKMKAIHIECSSDTLHEYRLECKRLRYSLDSFAGVTDEKEQQLNVLCKNLQTVLGDHQDTDDYTARIQQYALSQSALKHGAEMVFLLGKIHQRLQDDNKLQRAQFFTQWRKTQKTIAALTALTTLTKG